MGHRGADEALPLGGHLPWVLGRSVEVLNGVEVVLRCFGSKFHIRRTKNNPRVFWTTGGGRSLCPRLPGPPVNRLNPELTKDFTLQNQVIPMFFMVERKSRV